MGRPRKYNDQQLIDAVRECYSIRQVLNRIGLSPTGANYKGIQRRFEELGLDTSHFTGRAHLRGKTHNWSPTIPLDEILVRNSTYTSSTALKKRLLKAGLLENRCQGCGRPPRWRRRPLVLVLDHINGDRSDHRLHNLRLLCPNCNSQAATFAGRNKGRYTRPRRKPPGAREHRAGYRAAG